VKLLLDEMYPRRLAEQLRADGFDVLAVVELPDLVGRPDLDVAHFALGQGRVVVTENVVDYAPLDAAEHAGLILVNGARWPRTPKGVPRLRRALRARLGDHARSEVALVEWL
jgi:Domain of unknown function (DUF5615)